MNEQPDMINLGADQPDSASVTFRANWAMTRPEDTAPGSAPGSVRSYEIPPLRPSEYCAHCQHGLHDVIGYVVAYSHLSDAGVRFTDIAYVGGAQSYAQARKMRDEALARIQRGEVKATYAVIHWVYRNWHRTS
ncbi:hypothetical protein [Streptomyces cavernae]|uniref:hypothetical protein n=1 Tax=Streptomyces cavernae TaxID=2259034 RepID=UPI000FEBA326|nr:hypothetical protein [Streptomyces cavernae]